MFKLATTLFLYSTCTFAQIQDTTFFDLKWKIVFSRSDAAFYRLYEKTSAKQFLVKDYFINNTIQMMAEASQVDTLIKEGHCTYYKKFKNGSLKYYEGNYHIDKRDGTWTFYDKLGRIIRVEEYLHGYKIFPTEWHDTLGNIIIEPTWNKNSSYDRFLRDFILSYPTEIKNPNKDTVFVSVVIDVDGTPTQLKIKKAKIKT